jgi:HSP20 family protein
MLLRFDPFRELDRMTNGFATASRSTAPLATVPMDVVRSDNEVRLSFDLPGIDPADVELTVERNRLTVKAARSRDLAEGEKVVVGERPVGEWSRTLTLSEALDSSRVGAHFAHGVLTVTIPVAEVAQARRIEIATPVAPEASAN